MFKRHDGNRWGWEVELYEGQNIVNMQCFDYYTGKGCQAAIDFANDWDKHFTLQIGEKSEAS